MRRLRNTLYVFTEDAYLTLDGENVVAKVSGKETGRVPLHTLESILSFTYPGASPQLMSSCSERGVAMAFFSPRGRFLARACGRCQGNIHLRRRQYRLADDGGWALNTAKRFLMGKVYNSRWVLERVVRDHGLRVNVDEIRGVSGHLASALSAIQDCDDLASLRGIEGDAAAAYFSVFDEMILRDKESFRFSGRNRRPPTDRVNAMLSLFYSVLAVDCASALEGVGLDSYCGILHADRPGRESLALDLVEELRAVLVDRFVVTSINNRVVSAKDFVEMETGEVRLGDAGRKRLFEAWQEKKREQITHPYLKERIDRGLIPHVQALLLSQYIRGDLDDYPAFLWK